jgi:uncharacterized protein
MDMVAKISADLQNFVNGKLGWVATTGVDGMPNVTPKGTIRVHDEQTLVFADLFSLKTRENLLKNPKVAVTVIDQEKVQGYQFKGKAELIDAGPLFEQFKADLKKSPKSLPEPKYMAKITIEEIFDQSPGPDAGKKIGG